MQLYIKDSILGMDFGMWQATYEIWMESCRFFNQMSPFHLLLWPIINAIKQSIKYLQSKVRWMLLELLITLRILLRSSPLLTCLDGWRWGPHTSPSPGHLPHSPGLYCQLLLKYSTYKIQPHTFITASDPNQILISLHLYSLRPPTQKLENCNDFFPLPDPLYIFIFS